jgi:hypothetical protein
MDGRSSNELHSMRSIPEAGSAMPDSQHPNHADIRRAWVCVSRNGKHGTALEIATAVASMFEGVTTWQVLLIVSKSNDTQPGPGSG